MNFNIHNLLGIKIESEKKTYLNYLGREYSFFKTEERVAPDVKVIITDSVNPDSDSRLVNNKYFIKEGYFYCRDRYKVARWRLAINDLASKTVIKFSGGIWGEHVLKDFIMEPLTGFKLATKGFCILHASALAINGAGFIFAGGPGVGKTTAILNLGIHSNVFLSDEITILSNEGIIYSFPSPLRIYYYTLKSMTLPRHKIAPQQKLEAKIKYLAYILSLGYAKLPLYLDAEKLFEGTGGVYPLHRLILLTRTGDENIKTKEITDKKELVERLVLINEQQFPYWAKYISAYSSVYPSSQIASYSQMISDNLSKALGKATCYEVKTPRRFTEKHRDQFQQVIQTLGRVI